MSDETIYQAVEMLIINKNATFNNYGHIQYWDVSRVTNMSKLFKDLYFFSYDISSWDVSNVRDFSEMFYHTENFNSPLND